MHGETSEIYLLLISLRAHFASLLFSLFLTDVHFVEMAMLVADWKKKNTQFEEHFCYFLNLWTGSEALPLFTRHYRVQIYTQFHSWHS